MFRNIEFYDRLTGFFARPWWIYLLMGIDFILLAVLIVIFPALAAYLVAGFLMINGVLLVALGFNPTCEKCHPKNQKMHKFRLFYFATI